MNNLSIKSKVLLITILPVLITACVLSFTFINERLKDTEITLNDKGQTITQYLAPALEYGILSGNQNYLDTLVKNTLSIPEVNSITVLDGDRKILVHQSKRAEKQVRQIRNTDLNMIFSAKIYRSEIGINDIDGYDNKTTYSANKVIGRLIVGISRDKISAAQREIIRNGVLITFILLLLTIVMALYFSRTISVPISLLTKGINRIRDGMLGERIYTDAGGEVADLEAGINNMSAALQVAQLREKEHAEDTLFIEKSKAHITLEAIGEGVVTTDINGFVSYINPAAENLLGVNIDDATDMHLHKIFHIKNILGKESIDYPVSICLEEGKSVRHDEPMILIGNNATEFIIRDNATPLRTRDGKVTGMVLVFYDFTHIQRISDQLTYQATHDELTGLKNRREFERRLKDIITNSNFRIQKHALCFLDLDHFKIVNDTCGHVAGDALLKEVSQLLCSQVRHNDLVARLGGDEFGIILADCPLKQAVLIAENIKNAVKKYQGRWEQHVFDIGVSIGLMPIVSTDYSSAEIMIHADSACYIAKDSGKNRVHVYQATDHDFLHHDDEIRWFEKIKQALDKNSFELYCQVIVPTANDEVEELKYEVLLRLQDDGELLLPGYFLPAAEHYSLMPEIDRWVLKRFVMLLKENDVEHFRDKKPVFHINLSGQSVCNEGFFEFIVDLFDSASIGLELINFEITETAAIHNYNAAIKLISSLKKRGCAFALDDFGSGLSSFRYLKELPVDHLKIDGYFIRDIESSSINQSIVDAISSVARALDLKTIAEFVETKEAWQILKKYKIDYMQGSAIGMPLPLLDVLTKLKNL